MRRALASSKSERSAATLQTLWLTLGGSALLVLTVYASDPPGWNDPGWWTAQGAMTNQVVVTNGSTVTTNYALNNNAIANQGQLKQFTVAAYNELNADLTNTGGAGSALSNLVYGWQQDYATNNYNSTNNPYRPYKPSDFQAVNVGQLKYIASLIYSQLATNGYTGLYPSWIEQNTNTDGSAANIGQLKEVFNFDLNTAPAVVSNLTATTSNPGEIDLSWTLPSVNNATSLTIEYSTNGGTTWISLGSVNSTSTSYAATGLDPNSNYEFNVTANNTNPSSGQLQSTSSTPTTSIQPLPAPRFAVINLDQPGQGTFFPSQINALGSVLGYSSDLGAFVFWKNGISTILDFDANSLNNFDVVCGVVANLELSDSSIGLEEWSPPGITTILNTPPPVLDMTVFIAGESCTPSGLPSLIVSSRPLIDDAGNIYDFCEEGLSINFNSEFFGPLPGEAISMG